jgi:hypothetical protein
LTSVSGCWPASAAQQVQPALPFQNPGGTDHTRTQDANSTAEQHGQHVELTKSKPARQQHSTGYMTVQLPAGAWAVCLARRIKTRLYSHAACGAESLKLWVLADKPWQTVLTCLGLMTLGCCEARSLATSA